MNYKRVSKNSKLNPSKSISVGAQFNRDSDIEKKMNTKKYHLLHDIDQKQENPN